MTVTDLPTETKPKGLARLRALTGTDTDDAAVAEAIRKIEQVEANSETGPERNRRLLREMRHWTYERSSASSEDVVAAIAAGRAERDQTIMDAVLRK